jgi:hypothetical protein
MGIGCGYLCERVECLWNGKLKFLRSNCLLYNILLGPTTSWKLPLPPPLRSHQYARDQFVTGSDLSPTLRRAIASVSYLLCSWDDAARIPRRFADRDREMAIAAQLSSESTVRACLRSGAPTAACTSQTAVRLRSFRFQFQCTMASSVRARRAIDANSIAGKTTGFELDQAQAQAQAHSKL